jgi:tetratricopeptide (TPR) repeat protein
LEQRNRYIAAEKILLSDMAHADNLSGEYWLRLRLFDLYASAVRNGGETSLGKGSALFAASQKQLIALLTTTKDQTERLAYHQHLCELFLAAHSAKIPAAGKDLADYVAKIFPELAQKQVGNYSILVAALGGTIYTVHGPREAIAFYLDRMEQEHHWLVRTGEGGWASYHDEFSQYRAKVPKLGSLEPRLLALVVAEVKRDMRTHTQRSREMYSNDHVLFWKEKAADFAKAAEEVLAETKDGGPSVVYIATYLINDLDLRDRGIEILFDAHRREILDESGQQLLITTLFNRNRHGEAVALLEGLVKKHKTVLSWRIQLMRAYFMTKQPQALQRMLAETHKLFVDPHPNDEGILSSLGSSTLDNELYEPATKYYERVIKIRTDLLQTHTQGDGALAGYYQQQARAYAGLGNTELAVDKASAAIVIWPSRHEYRTEAIKLLGSMLERSPDLDAYVKVLDKQVKEEQGEKPIIRKQVGIVYQKKFKAWDKAITQFRLAVEAAPDDPELHERLIACLDAKGDAAGALAQSLESLDLNRRNLELWDKLASRFAALKQPVEAERAATSLVEVSPQETEGHAKLATYREKQDRWDDAIFQWRLVAQLRKLEPTGLLGLLPALLHQKQLEEFDAAMKQLENGNWPEHFGETLKKELPKLRADRLKANQ